MSEVGSWSRPDSGLHSARDIVEAAASTDLWVVLGHMAAEAGRGSGKVVGVEEHQGRHVREAATAERDSDTPLEEAQSCILHVLEEGHDPSPDLGPDQDPYDVHQRVGRRCFRKPHSWHWHHPLGPHLAARPAVLSSEDQRAACWRFEKRARVSRVLSRDQGGGVVGGGLVSGSGCPTSHSRAANAPC